jgi:hypothetical protein
MGQREVHGLSYICALRQRSTHIAFYIEVANRYLVVLMHNACKNPPQTWCFSEPVVTAPSGFVPSIASNSADSWFSVV